MYRAEVLSNSGTVNEKIMKYIRSNSRTFKVRKSEHEGERKKKKEAGGTTLTTYIWKLKEYVSQEDLEQSIVICVSLKNSKS